MYSGGRLMAKATLYVQDELWDRAQRYDGQIQFSALFQRALSTEIRRIERETQEQEEIDMALDLGSLDVPALRARLLDERADLYRTGAAIARQHLDAFAYGLLRYYESLDWDLDQVVRLLPEPAALALRSECVADPISPSVRDAVDATVVASDREVKRGLVDALRRIWGLAMDAEGEVGPAPPKQLSPELQRIKDGTATSREMAAFALRVAKGRATRAEFELHKEMLASMLSAPQQQSD
jgi:hypothetical protein